jgi:electron transfer flavoprotein beta subunit
MRILVLMRMVPDVVEELEVAPDGVSLDTEFMRMIVNERDDHALEQALLLKERHGGTVTVLAGDAPEVDDVLFTALAKGADRAAKVAGADAAGTRAMAAALLGAVAALQEPADLVLTGCQAIDDLDGFVGPLVAEAMGLPYAGLVNRVEVAGGGGTATITKEYAGGVLGRFEVSLPAVIGMQGAERPPRYVPIAKVRAAMSAGGIEEAPAGEPDAVPAIEVLELASPEAGGTAEMLSGSVDDVAAALADILADRGMV